MCCVNYISIKEKEPTALCFGYRTPSCSVSLHVRCPDPCPTLRSPLRHSNSPHPVPPLHPRAGPIALPGGTHAARSACYKEGKKSKWFSLKANWKDLGQESNMFKQLQAKEISRKCPSDWWDSRATVPASLGDP